MTRRLSGAVPTLWNKEDIPMKRLIAIALLILALLGLAACGGEKRIVHCDRCGKEIEIPADSNVTEDWIVMCKECEEEVGPIVQP